jgi:hypothetical protein
MQALRMRRATSAPTWTTVKGPTTLNNDANGYGGYTLRERLPASVLTDIAGTQMRITLHAASGTQTVITKMYVGLKGAGNFDFATTPVQVLFSGSASKTVTAGSGPYTSDAFSLTYDGTSDLVIAIYSSAALNSNSYLSLAAPQTTTVAYKLGDDAITTTVSGYTNAATGDVVEKIEVS